jgi:hypothetical protein
MLFNKGVVLVQCFLTLVQFQMALWFAALCLLSCLAWLLEESIK